MSTVAERHEKRQWNTQPRVVRTCLRCGESGKWEHEERVRHPEGHTVMVRGCEYCFDHGGDVNHGLPLCVLGSCEHAHTIDETCEAAKARIEGAPTPELGAAILADFVALGQPPGSICPACHSPATSERDGLPVCGNPACRGFGWAHRYIAAPATGCVYLRVPSGSPSDRGEACRRASDAMIPLSRIAHIPRHRPGPVVRIEPEDWP